MHLIVFLLPCGHCRFVLLPAQMNLQLESQDMWNWKDSQGSQSPAPGPAQEHLQSHSMCVRALSKLFLSSPRLSGATTALGNLFHPLDEKLFLISNLSLL